MKRQFSCFQYQSVTSMVSGSMLTPSSQSPYWQLIYCLSGVIEITESNLIVIFTFTFYADFPLPPDEFKLTSECTSTSTSNTSPFYFHFPKDYFCLRMSAFSPYPFTFISILTFPFHLHFHFFSLSLFSLLLSQDNFHLRTNFSMQE